MEQLHEKLGICVLCNERVHSNERFLKTAEGYIHYSCLNQTDMMKA